ncbi:MAG: hypothetical protein RML56_07830 [Burkholderiales bacterium]|nr:hypothetical protein [Burkholderiales bacterium]
MKPRLRSPPLRIAKRDRARFEVDVGRRKAQKLRRPLPAKVEGKKKRRAHRPRGQRLDRPQVAAELCGRQHPIAHPIEGRKRRGRRRRVRFDAEGAKQRRRGRVVFGAQRERIRRPQVGAQLRRRSALSLLGDGAKDGRNLARPKLGSAPLGVFRPGLGDMRPKKASSVSRRLARSAPLQKVGVGGKKRRKRSALGFAGASLRLREPLGFRPPLGGQMLAKEAIACAVAARELGRFLARLGKRQPRAPFAVVAAERDQALTALGIRVAEIEQAAAACSNPNDKASAASTADRFGDPLARRAHRLNASVGERCGRLRHPFSPLRFRPQSPAFRLLLGCSLLPPNYPGILMKRSGIKSRA